MHTPFDVVSLILFAGLAVLFLQRSSSREPDPVPLWRYALAAAGCAAGDILGNHGQNVIGWADLVATVGFAAILLKPFNATGR